MDMNRMVRILSAFYLLPMRTLVSLHRQLLRLGPPSSGGRMRLILFCACSVLEPLQVVLVITLRLLIFHMGWFPLVCLYPTQSVVLCLLSSLVQRVDALPVVFLCDFLSMECSYCVIPFIATSRIHISPLRSATLFLCMFLDPASSFILTNSQVLVLDSPKVASINFVNSVDEIYPCNLCRRNLQN